MERSRGEPALAGVQPMLELHEQLEDSLVYSRLVDEMGPGTPLADWAVRHDLDVDTVNQLVARVNELSPGTVEWQAAVGAVSDALNRHVMDEEGQIFGRIEQAWGPDRLASVVRNCTKACRRNRPLQRLPRN